MDLFTHADNLEAGRESRDRGIARAESNSPNWTNLARTYLKNLCERQEFIHSNDLIAFCESYPAPSRGATGALFMHAITRKWMEGTGRYEPSTDKKRHAKKTEVYRSLIYRGRG